MSSTLQSALKSLRDHRGKARDMAWTNPLQLRSPHAAYGLGTLAFPVRSLDRKVH